MIEFMNKLVEKNRMQIKDKSPTSHSVYLPLGINMKDIRCLIVGGGRIATRKAETLLGANASVTILSTSITSHLYFLSDTSQLSWEKSEYQPEYLVDYDFIISATSDRTLNIKIGKDADKLGKLYCVVSSGQHSKVIFPAIYKNKMLTVGVHSNGTNCRYSKAIRNKIAAHIEKPNGTLQKLIMFGFDRSKLGREAFSRLKDFENSLAQKKSLKDELLILVTCQRWECYIQASSSRQLVREILHQVKELFGSTWEECKTKIQYKYGHTAYYHLLSVCLGLDSPLVGETEIVNQTQCAMAKWVGSETSQLHETFASVLLTARKIRHSTNLRPVGKSWSSNVTSLINDNLVHANKANILIVGNGRLSRSVIEQIIISGHTVVNFSRHFKEIITSQVTGYTIRHTDEIGDYLDDADVVIICSELTSKALSALKHYKHLAKPIIIDLEGYNGILRPESGEPHYISLSEIPQIKLNAEKLRNIANARIKSLEQSLVWYGTYKVVESPVEIIRIGARQSLLSRAQVTEIQCFLKALAEDIKLEEVFIDVPCDRDRKISLPQVQDDDFFTRDIDKALLAGEIDIAVHSAKDLPQRLTRGLAVAAVTPSISPWECLVSKGNLSLCSLPKGSVVGTSSIHRREILARIRPDIRAVDIRGNVPDRIEQLDAGKFDALILACAGLIRLGLTERIIEVFAEKLFPYTPGQGSLALLVRENDVELINFLKPLDLARSTLVK